VDGAWATLLTREDYLPGVRVLWRSLQDVSSAYPLVVMVTAGVSRTAREQLTADGCQVLEVAGGPTDTPRRRRVLLCL
jgi:hypothetical protein